jgi:hypothetical protein
MTRPTYEELVAMLEKVVQVLWACGVERWHESTIDECEALLARAKEGGKP